MQNNSLAFMWIILIFLVLSTAMIFIFIKKDWF